VKNGTFGTIECYDEKKSLLTVCLEDKWCTDQKRRVQFNTQAYPHLTHGYAMGVHKSEGNSFDQAFVVLDPLMDPQTLLVALTRHRDGMQLYVNREQFMDFKAIVSTIGYLSPKTTLQDYHLTQEQQPYFNRVQQYRDLIIEGVTLREEMEGSLPSTQPQPLPKHPSYAAYQSLFEEKKRVAETILKDWQNHLPYVRLAGIRQDVLEVDAGLRPHLLSDLEHRASLQVQLYRDHVQQARTLWQSISPTHPGSLVKSHPLYGEYHSHQTERNSIAAVIQENLTLYAPFFRVTKDEQTGELADYWGEKVEKDSRVFLTCVNTHAAAHQHSQAQRIFYERLTPEDKGHFDAVKAYVAVRNDAAALYGYLKKQAAPSNLESFHSLQKQRDELALKLVSSVSLEKLQPFLPVLKVPENKLLDHARAGELRQKLPQRHIAAIATGLLGAPNPHLSSKTALRFGSKGSFVINTSGPKAGFWKDFESGEGGNLLHLIQRKKKLDPRAALSYMTAQLKGLPPLKKAPSTSVQPTQAIQTIASRLNGVLELQMKSKPIKCTPAETYLRQERGIQGPFSEALRYLPKGTTFRYHGETKTLQHDCLGAFGTNAEGSLRSVQLTKLTQAGKRALTPDGKKLNKIHYGIAKGSFVCVQEDAKTSRVFLAEGVETALSLKEAGIHGSIMASLGIHNIPHYQGPEKEIILCADNDSHKEHSQTYKVLEKAQEQLTHQGKVVSVIMPTQPGEDFNDVLKKEGIEGVKTYVKDYLAPELQHTPAFQANEKETLKAPSPTFMETVVPYLEAKLREIKAFEGSSLANQAKQDLDLYLKLFEKEKDLMQELRLSHRELAKELDQHVHHQIHLSKVLER
jgi:Toprim domain